jgi:ribosomal protein S18 acetylase RimI-like enzyme
MALVEVHDRQAIAALLRRDARTHVYEIGDLDDFDWPHTRWFGWMEGDALREVVLLYTQPAVPVLLTIGDASAEMTGLLEAVTASLPGELYVHASAPLLEILTRRYAVTGAAPHLKLALGGTEAVQRDALPVDVLDAADLDAICELYAAAYPGTWFEPRMLATGRYVGIREQGRLACVAGVHVYSPTWGVAALGNVATLPELRGRGLARGACAALCRLLLADGIETIALNVRDDNVAAIRSYTRLGFEPVAEYVEASLVARGV